MLWLASSVQSLQTIINNLVSRFRFNYRQFIGLGILGLVAHYFGFIWALTKFKPFYSDWMFFINLSLGFIFTLALVALAIQLIVSMLSLVDIVLSAIIPDRIMRVDRVMRFKIPVLRIQAVGYALIGFVFIWLLLILYTDMNWWQIALTLLIIPVTTAVWGLVIYWTVRNHKIEELELDLGEKFELSATNVENAVQVIQDKQHQIEAYIANHLPENLRALFEEVMAYMHDISARIGDAIPDKEEIHADITRLQFQLAELRWDIAYARFAMPKIRSMMVGAFLACCILLGYFHQSDYVTRHALQLTTQSGETRIVTPILQRGSWQVFYENGELKFENRANLATLEPIK